MGYTGFSTCSLKHVRELLNNDFSGLESKLKKKSMNEKPTSILIY
jgi:hypothetical protein